MQSITVELPRVPKSLTKNGRRRSHWQIQRRETQEMLDDARILILSELERDDTMPWQSADIHIHQKWSNNPLDYEGLASGVAPVVDAFTLCGVVEDDSPRYIRSFTMTHQKVAKQTENAVVVTVTKVNT